MGQSGSSTTIIFQTAFGWTGFERNEAGVLRVWMGYRTRADLLAATPGKAVLSEDDSLALRIQDYFTGTPDDFADVPFAAAWNTPFQRAVIGTLRQVPYGQTTTYAELAKKAGRPGAARAVGQVMATNPVPLLVPCHRVLGSGGALGGFSAPTGIVLKRRLLELERQGCAASAGVRAGQPAFAS
jgi:methylated-DNA-[protein]-cysteine S-methyltransferase